MHLLGGAYPFLFDKSSPLTMKQICFSVFLAIRDICADWLKGTEPRDDPILQGKKDVETGFRVELPKRNLPPSNSQVIHTSNPVFMKPVCANLFVISQK